MKNILIILLLSYGCAAHAQETNKRFLHNLNLGLLGQSIYASVNYDATVVLSENIRLSAGAGFSYYPPLPITEHSIFPFHLTALVGENNIYFEGGMGYSTGNYVLYEDVYDYRADMDFLFPRLGVRYQKPTRGLTASAHINIMYRLSGQGQDFHLMLFDRFVTRGIDSKRSFFPWPGVNIGYTF